MRRSHFSALALVVSAALLVGGGCENMRKDRDRAGDAKSSPATRPAHATGAQQPGGAQSGKSLYDRLGGEQAIRAVVSDFVERSAADPKVNFTRAGTAKEWQATPESVQRLEDRLTEFVAQGTGGPQRYTGQQMRAVHTGMNITDAEFNALAGHLKGSLQKYNVPQREQAELMAIIEATRKDVVGL